MKSLVTLARVYIHTQGNLINNKKDVKHTSLLNIKKDK